MRLLIFLIIFSLLGCATINENSKIYPMDEFYTLKLYSGKEWMPEYGGLRKKITKQKYRILPYYLQDCYKKEDTNVSD